MKVKVLLPFILALAASAAHSQVSLKVSQSGKELGTARLTQKLLADGSKSVEMKIEFSSPDEKLTVRQTSLFDKEGNPSRKLLEVSDGKGYRRQTIATLTDEGAATVYEESAKRKTQLVKLNPGLPRANISEFWFLRDQPKEGQSFKTYILNMDRLEWELAEITYDGRRNVTVGGANVRAHHVTSRIGDRVVKSSLDDKGLPLLITDSRGLRMERISGKTTEWKGNPKTSVSR